MIVQWQLVDVETGKAIKVEGELELVGCEEFFTKVEHGYILRQEGSLVILIR